MTALESLAKSRPRGVRSLSRWLGITLAGGAVLAGATIFFARRELRERVERERELMANDRVAPLTRVPLDGPDPSEWLEQIGLAAPTERARVTSESCEIVKLSSAWTFFDFLGHIAHWIDRPEDAGDLRACGLTFFRADLELCRTQLELARQVTGYGSRSAAPPEPTFDGATGEVTPPVTRGFLDCQRVLCESAWVSAADGDGERAFADLRLAARALRTFDTSSSEFAATSVLEGRMTWLRTLSLVARELPGERTMLELDAIADEFEPWRDVERCWQSNRTAGLQEIQSRRRELEGSWEPGPLWLGTEAWLDHEETLFLESLRDTLGRARAHELRRPRPDHSIRPWEELSSRLAPDPFNLHYTAEDLESLLPVVRAFVLARRDGAEAAIEWASSTADPCGGQPLRTQFDGRTLMVWSLGLGSTDEGGHPELDAVLSLQKR
ncbi:MAG: hypothetical protein NTV21_09470 [Planctomycetota bacterium]|nr:hypothetical protein [Planctomycetota bacterium]